MPLLPGERSQLILKPLCFESLLQMKQSREISGMVEAGTSCITFLMESPSSFLEYVHKEEEKRSFQWSIRAEPSSFSTSTHCTARIVHVQPFPIRGVECSDCNGW